MAIQSNVTRCQRYDFLKLFFVELTNLSFEDVCKQVEHIVVRKIIFSFFISPITPYTKYKTSEATSAFSILAISIEHNKLKAKMYEHKSYDSIEVSFPFNIISCLYVENGWATFVQIKYNFEHKKVNFVHKKIGFDGFCTRKLVFVQKGGVLKNIVHTKVYMEVLKCT